MEIRYNSSSSKVSVDMSRKEYLAFLRSFDNVLRGCSKSNDLAVDRIIARNFLYILEGPSIINDK